MRRLCAAALLGALCLSASAKAEEPATPAPPAETVMGACPHPDETVLRWLRLVGYGTIASYGCEAASLDWSNRLTFYRDRDASKAGITIIGRIESNGAFNVAAIKPALLPEVPASGRCRVIMPEDASARRVLCFAKESGDTDRVHLVELVIAEKDWPGTAAIPGRCSAPGIGEYVLVPWIAQQTGEMPVVRPQPLPTCQTMSVKPGQSFAFAATGTRDEVTFLGTPDAEQPTRLKVKEIVLPGGVRHMALAGACLPKREADGHVTVLCMAAYADGGATRYVEVGFIPAGSHFEWPREPGTEEAGQ